MSCIFYSETKTLQTCFTHELGTWQKYDISHSLKYLCMQLDNSLLISLQHVIGYLKFHNTTPTGKIFSRVLDKNLSNKSSKKSKVIEEA